MASLGNHPAVRYLDRDKPFTCSVEIVNCTAITSPGDSLFPGQPCGVTPCQYSPREVCAGSGPSPATSFWESATAQHMRRLRLGSMNTNYSVPPNKLKPGDTEEQFAQCGRGRSFSASRKGRVKYAHLLSRHGKLG